LGVCSPCIESIETGISGVRGAGYANELHMSIEIS